MRIEEVVCQTEGALNYEIKEASKRKNASVLLSENAVMQISNRMILGVTPWGQWSYIESFGAGDERVVFEKLDNPDTIICISFDE